MSNPGATTQIATLAGGCFWCLEAVYVEMAGVQSVRSGYIGGRNANPTYRDVCSGTTGHAEAVEIVFDPQVTTYRELLEVFFTIHDPTTLNQQGADRGTQYRSAIYFHNADQERTAREVIRELEAARIWPGPFVTEVVAAPEFYVAEPDHQNYFAENPYQPYCMAVVSPKVKKFREKFAGKRKG